MKGGGVGRNGSLASKSVAKGSLAEMTETFIILAFVGWASYLMWMHWKRGDLNE